MNTYVRIPRDKALFYGLMYEEWLSSDGTVRVSKEALMAAREIYHRSRSVHSGLQCAAVQPAEQPATPAQTVAAAEAALAIAKQAHKNDVAAQRAASKAAAQRASAAASAEQLAALNAAEHAARKDRLEADKDLAAATSALLYQVQAVLNGSPEPEASPLVSRHIDALQPLAKRHGMKIVFIGNKTLATIVKL